MDTSLSPERKRVAGTVRRQDQNQYRSRTLWERDRLSEIPDESSFVSASGTRQRPIAPGKLDHPLATKNGLSRVTEPAAAANSAAPLSEEQVLQILGRLYATLKFSLAGYLCYARPWSVPTDERLRQTLQEIADEQKKNSDRAGSLIIERRGHFKGGVFPLRFASFNDLSLVYLAPLVVEDLERIVREVKSLARQLASNAPAYNVTLEILWSEQALLDNLRELIDSR